MFMFLIAMPIYLVGWLIFAVNVFRIGLAYGHCTSYWDRQKRYCGENHSKACWSHEVGSIDVVQSCTLATLWPVAWLPMLAIFLAKKKPPYASLHNRIAELEKENEIS